MRKLLLPFTFLLFVATSCNKSDDNATPLDALEGTWRTEKTTSDYGNPINKQEVDKSDALNYTDFVFKKNGTLVSTEIEDKKQPVVKTMTYTVMGDQIVVVDNETAVPETTVANYAITAKNKLKVVFKEEEEMYVDLEVNEDSRKVMVLITQTIEFIKR